MGIIQKNPLDGMASQFYTVGLNKNIVVAGLGNIGNEYEETRHNVGFTCLDSFVLQNNFDPWAEKKNLHCLLTSRNLGATRVIAIKPTTLMNLSGEAVAAVIHYYKVELRDVVVVHDELDIPFGQIRIRRGGSDAGHNGVKSVSAHIGEGYGRIRIGIGPKIPEQMDSADFVLARFSGQEQAHIKALTLEVNAILAEYIYGDQLQPETRAFIV
ncbi:MAG TPA: aminoacyl-tRNA hydrolase [Candidatus Saccharimonadales bacterium]|nr:aminoacyl-tRNA hydrolase [Candidatus Saccharimonadales bacterium]